MTQHITAKLDWWWEWPGKVLRDAVLNGNAQLLAEWIRDAPEKEIADVRSFAVRNGNVAVLEVVHNYKIKSKDRMEGVYWCVRFKDAMSKGDTVLMDWLEKNNYVVVNDNIPEISCDVLSYEELLDAANNALRRSILENNVSVVLEWLSKRNLLGKICEKLFGEGKLCRYNDTIILYSIRIKQKVPPVIEWIVNFTNLETFSKKLSPQIWWTVWHRKTLIIMLNDRRKRRRLPPELWKLIEDYC